MDYNYLVFLYFTTIVGPALLLAAFYSHIYNIILKQVSGIRLCLNGGRQTPPMVEKTDQI